MSELQLFKYFSTIEDTRQSGKIAHKLFDILFLTVSAVIAGSQGWEEIEEFGHDRLGWLRKFVAFENGIPTHDTIARVISKIDMHKFQSCFSKWMKDCHQATDGQVIAIDGKRLKGSFNQSDRKDAIHMVSAFACQNGLVLGQQKTDRKSNEITAIPELLALLEIKGCLVTIDAMGCQKGIAQKILDKEADYLLALKANQSGLYTQVQSLLGPEISRQCEQGTLFQEADYQRNREEYRCCITSNDLSQLPASLAWPELKTVGVIISYRNEKDKKSKELSSRYYISSAKLLPEELASSAREHWRIENGLHWKLDVGMKEDDCRIRRDGAPEIMAGVRHIAMNQLQSEKSFKKGVRAKQMKANRNTNYLEKIMFNK
ncbi:ISAs1 family transposase [Shewanella sp.]|nr:ISAs1 family transposase [Shewanella sp.]